MSEHTQGLVCAGCDQQIAEDGCDQCGKGHGSQVLEPEDLPPHDCPALDWPDGEEP